MLSRPCIGIREPVICLDCQRYGGCLCWASSGRLCHGSGDFSDAVSLAFAKLADFGCGCVFGFLRLGNFISSCCGIEKDRRPRQTPCGFVAIRITGLIAAIPTTVEAPQRERDDPDFPTKSRHQIASGVRGRSTLSAFNRTSVAVVVRYGL